MLFHPSYHCASQTASWGTCDTRQIDERGKVALEREEEGRGREVVSTLNLGTYVHAPTYLRFSTLHTVYTSMYIRSPTYIQYQR